MRIITIVLALLVFNFSNAQKKKPNILFIIVDDQAPRDFDFYDKDSKLNSPVISKLAADGMVLDGARHMGAMLAAVCTASRRMLVGGRTLWNIRSFDKYTNPNNRDDLDDNSLPAVFNKAGYTTVRTCKKPNSYKEANLRFKINTEAIKREGNDEDGSTWHANQILNYLNEREAQKENNPFLIYLGFTHPHDNRNGKPELLAKYGAVNHTDRSTLPPANPKQPQLPVNYLPSHPHKDVIRARDESGVSGVWGKRDERTIRNEIGRQYACVENIDIQIGRVLKKLEAMGELENTYIFYTSDHGIAIGKHGLTGKQNLYEHSLRDLSTIDY